jgi:hypothetical protein
MNFLSRLGHGIVIMIPTALVAFVLIYGAWNWTCNSTSCKIINLLVMLTGLVLAGWSLIVLVARLGTENHQLKMSTGKSLAVNLTEILPTVLFYAAFTGAMAFFCFTMLTHYLANTEKGINKLLFFCGLFLPLYELSRIMERKSSVKVVYPEVPEEMRVYFKPQKPWSFPTLIKIHLQSVVTFAGWYYLMMFILKNRSSLPGFTKKPGWENISLFVAMGLASIILYICYELAERSLRQQGVIKWNSRYFGKS